MASVFTYDPNPPRVSSPWPASAQPVLPSSEGPASAAAGGRRIAEAADCGVTRLEAEPQEGPVEYKLHLLLRPRRKLSACTTVLRVSGSNQSRIREVQPSAAASPFLARAPALPIPTSQSRQNRLQNLTTQLLWRLQQSSPHHSSSKSDLVIPNLQDTGLKASSFSNGYGKLHPGLEESQGALYEIGVSDDGVFVGLVKDELDESLATLCTMAHSLGCGVEVLREVIVGKCQWTEEVQSLRSLTERHREDVLWVAEALVTPNLGPKAQKPPLDIMGVIRSDGASLNVTPDASFSVRRTSEQLRVSLTGSTTSGKSSLLGVLSTSMLDDGRGKIRKSLHKHLHEIASGITSSLVTELIGYQDTPSGHHTDVINFASGSVSQWTDIHDSCNNGRLVVVTDSAGHLKYRRTTVRGLMSWAPHWTLCCIAADNEQFLHGNVGSREDAEEHPVDVGSSTPNASRAHLELCLKLGLPLVIVITKLDLASTSSLRRIVGEVLTCLKAAGRQVAPMFANTTPADDRLLQALLSKDLREARDLFANKSGYDPLAIVPVVLTSAVTGAGIRKLHALLRHLPVPTESRTSNHKEPHGRSITSAGLFHIDEVFATSDARSIALLDGSRSIEGHVVSGHLSHASTELGDTWFIGPFDAGNAAVERNMIHPARSCPSLEQLSVESNTARGSTRIVSRSLVSQPGSTEKVFAAAETWRRVRVVSLRNLRLPVRQLAPGQVGTIGITYEDFQQDRRSLKTALEGRVRKGMVMIRDEGLLGTQELPAYRGFVGVFPQHDGRTIAPGALVKVYVASIRASAKVLTVKGPCGVCSSEDVFAFDDGNTPANLRATEGAAKTQQIEVTIEFQGAWEWFEFGCQVLLMPERGDGGSVGLDGIVGNIIHALW